MLYVEGLKRFIRKLARTKEEDYEGMHFGVFVRLDERGQNSAYRHLDAPPVNRLHRCGHGVFAHVCVGWGVWVCVCVRVICICV